MKDDAIAKLVNTLRDIAVEFHGTQQLRDRLSQAVVPVITDLRNNRTKWMEFHDRLSLRYDELEGEVERLRAEVVRYRIALEVIASGHSTATFAIERARQALKEPSEREGGDGE